MRTTWIVRHADRLDFEDPSWFPTATRPHDPPLSPSGRVRARTLGERLRPEAITHLFASPFLRAVETAHEIADVLDLPIGIEPGLSEWLNRDWFATFPDTLPVEFLAARHPRIDPSRAPLGAARWGESGIEAEARAGETARRLVTTYPGNLVLVGHGASVLGATAGLLGGSPGPGCPPDMPYCFVVRLVEHDGTWTFAR